MVQHLKEKLREICDFFSFLRSVSPFWCFLLRCFSKYPFETLDLQCLFYFIFAFLMRICLGKFFPLFDTRYLPRATLRYFVGKKFVSFQSNFD